jgi:hypothetical protein
VVTTQMKKSKYNLVLATIAASIIIFSLYFEKRSRSRNNYIRAAELITCSMRKSFGNKLDTVIVSMTNEEDREHSLRKVDDKLSLFASDLYQVAVEGDKYAISGNGCRFTISLLSKDEAAAKEPVERKEVWLAALSSVPLTRCDLEKMCPLDHREYIKMLTMKACLMGPYENIYLIGNDTILLCSYIDKKFEGRIWLYSGGELIIIGEFTRDFESIARIIQTIKYENNSQQ